jgi:hypothetical protein
MTNPVTYIHLESLTMSPGEMTKEAEEEAYTTWSCPDCKFPKPGTKQLDVQIVNSTLQGPLNFATRCCIPLAKLSFLMRLGKERVERELYLGKVFGPKGEIMNDWVTFRGKRGIIVRGTEKAGYRACPKCDRNFYFALGPYYLYPQPPIEVEIFGASLCGLVIPVSVAIEAEFVEKVSRGRGEWVKLAKIKHVHLQKLTVLDKPKDCLPPLDFLP